MTINEKKIWGIHSWDDSYFLKNNLIGIGWPLMGDISLIENNRDKFKEKFNEVYPNNKKGRINLGVGMLYRFLYEVQIGDYIILPSKVDRMINIGVIESDYYYESKQEEYVQQRKVKWIKHFPRTNFSQGALYELGSAMSFFSVKNHSDEFLNAIDNQHKKVEILDEEEQESVAANAEEIIETTKDYLLKELSRNLKGYDLEEFISDLLNAMGYRTTLSKKGGDSGIDIIAYKDELPPRILVQVKSHDGNVNESTIQSLKGAMREGDYGLFVTLSNYTDNAKKYLLSTPIIRGINGSDLVDLILKYYDSIDDKYKRIIPLKKVYIPVPREE